MSAVALVLVSLALAQDGPWGPTSPPPSEPPPPDPAPPAEAPPPRDRNVPAPPDPLPMPAHGARPTGWRIGAIGGSTGVRVAQEFVVGRTGGTNATAVEARIVNRDGASLAVAVPFAAYRTPEGREVDIGNLRVELGTTFGKGRLVQGIAFEGHGHVGGSRAWTWSNDADALWPGAGAGIVWRGRADLPTGTALLFQGSGAVNAARAYEPFPSVFLTLQGAAAIDQPLGDMFGVIGEATITYWDMSPFETTALFRADPIDGLRLRGGLVLPMAVWAGWTPSGQDSGLTEATLVFDVAMNL